ncbi:MAG: cyclic pyranopterin monophosphate synthase MoaC [Candidatus Methanosuratincola sp.]|jgi:cyclic pyranopterin phosphate synthase|nr:cyclic pyranopterin monophosphate synthase MoaC [Candidatus Methanosuratincola sp.]
MSVKMVDVGGKPPVLRIAVAGGSIRLKPSTIVLIKSNSIEKGDVLAVARVAAIQAVKRTSESIPLCHPIPVDHVSVEFTIGADRVECTVQVRAVAKTGVEMEALCGVSAALLTIWDMTKKYEKDEKGQYPETFISEIRVLNKYKGEQGNARG